MAFLAVSFSSVRCRSSAAFVSAFVPSSTRTLSGGMIVRNSGITPSIRLMASAPSTKAEVDADKVVEMKDLRILSYPHPALRAENAEITKEELDSGEISKIVKKMFSLMYATSGVGLAAPQVGINKKFMVYNQSGDSKKWLDETVMINPKIIEFSVGTDFENEGCLSLEGMKGEVQRSKWIKVEAMNMKGKKIKKKYKGWEARIFQHELDHLNGVLFFDRMTAESQKEVEPIMEEMIAEFGDGGAL